MRTTIQSISLLVLMVLILSACAPSAPSTADSAAMFHNGPTHTGLYSSAGPRALGGVKWKFQTGDKVRGGPVISGGVVYIGSHDGTFYALK